MPEYIAAADVVCIGAAIDTDPVFSVSGDEIKGLGDAIKVMLTDGPVAVFAHNIAFHRTVWQKLKWPEPTEWCCTMSAMKRKEPKEKKFSMAALCQRHGLPEKITVDEMSLNGKCTNALLKAAERDAALVRALAEVILDYPRTEIVA